MKKLKVLSWNINGIRAIHRKKALDWLQTEKPDMLCLQEIKALEEQMPEEVRAPEGYHACFRPADRKGYSGVGIYSREKPLCVKKGFGVKRFDAEGRTIAAEFKNFALYSIYFPNGNASPERLKYKMDFYGAFLRHAVKRVKTGDNLVICGDVNTAHTEIDLARPKENSKVSGFLPEERAWIDTFLAKGFVDTLRIFNKEPHQYSWWDYKTRARERNVGWRLDYFFVNEGFKKHVKDAFIRTDIMGSDHCPVGIDIKI